MDISKLGQNNLLWLAVPVICAVLLIIGFRSRRARSDVPPTVPYTIPWVGSSLAMAKDPDAFFSNATARFGPIFGLQVAGSKRYFITSPTLIRAIHKQSKAFVFRPIRTQMFHTVFGMSYNSVYKQGVLTDDFYDDIHRILAPSSISVSQGLLSSYSKFASAEIVNYTPPENSVPARVLLYNMLYRASGSAFFGPAFDADGTIDDFIHYDRMFPLLSLELPWPFSQPALSARAKMMKHMEAYVAKPYQPAEYISYLKNYLEQCGVPEDLPPIYLTFLWALEANAPLVAYWTIVLSLFHPNGLAPLVAEIDAARSSWETTNPSLSFNENCNVFVAQSELPLLSSTINETLRFSTSSFSIRRVLEPTTFSGYTFLPGEEVVCVGRVGQIDRDLFDEPNSFVPNRFVSADTASTKDGKNTTSNMAPFGGGVSICEGRHFAQSELKIFVCLLLTYLHVELDPKAKKEDVAFDVSRIGLGVIHPKGDVMLSVRRRT